jgi:hypothetical protein
MVFLLAIGLPVLLGVGIIAWIMLSGNSDGL